MAGKQRGFVEVSLDKKRYLRYTLNALALIEEKLGRPVTELGEINLGMRELRLLLWAGLRHEDKELTEEMVGEMIDFDNIEYVNEKMSEAFSLSQKNVKSESTGKN